jgi:hypothetical protein
MQSAADAAALGAATALSTGHPANFSTEAYADAAAVGFVNGVNGVVITVNKPPASGTHTTVQTAVQVIITQPQTLSLVWLFGSGSSIRAWTLWRCRAIRAPIAFSLSTPPPPGLFSSPIAQLDESDLRRCGQFEQPNRPHSDQQFFHRWPGIGGWELVAH